MRSRVLPLIALCIAVVAPEAASAHDLYGEVVRRDRGSKSTRPIDRRVRIEVFTDNQRVTTVSHADGTYHLHVAEEGRWKIIVHYRGHELESTIPSFYLPNRFDLVVERRPEGYTLVPIWREWRLRNHDDE